MPTIGPATKKVGSGQWRSLAPKPSNCRVNVDDLGLHVHLLAGDTVLTAVPGVTRSTRTPLGTAGPNTSWMPPGCFQVSKPVSLLATVLLVGLDIELREVTFHMVRLVQLNHPFLLTCDWERTACPREGLSHTT